MDINNVLKYMDDKDRNEDGVDIHLSWAEVHAIEDALFRQACYWNNYYMQLYGIDYSSISDRHTLVTDRLHDLFFLLSTGGEVNQYTVNSIKEIDARINNLDMK